MNLEGLSLGELVKTVAACRAKSAAINAEVKGKLTSLAEIENDARLRIITMLDAEGTTSKKGDYGQVTIATEVKPTLVPGAWESFFEYCRQTMRPDFIQKRMAVRAVRDHIEAHPEESVPGVTLERVRTLRITQPKGGQ